MSDVVNPPAIIRKADELLGFAMEINRAYEEGERAMHKGMDHYRRVGEFLVKAKVLQKRISGHGSWQEWLQKNFKYTSDMAVKCMRIYKYWDMVKETMSIREAIDIISDYNKKSKELNVAKHYEGNGKNQNNLKPKRIKKESKGELPGPKLADMKSAISYCSDSLDSLFKKYDPWENSDLSKRDREILSEKFDALIDKLKLVENSIRS